MIYKNPSDYKGKEFEDLLRALNKRQLKQVVRKSYRRVANKIANIARNDLSSSGLRNGSLMKKNIRVRVYPRGSGFMVTVKPHGNQGYYKRSQDGKEKPVAMWAAEGTKYRFARHGRHIYPAGLGYKWMKSSRNGEMPSYHFLENAEKQGQSIVENDLGQEFTNAANDRLRKEGFI